jgi:hypothetical protein
MVTINSQLQMHSAEDPSSHIPMLELVNGGKSDSIKDTLLTESEFKTEEIAAVQDLEEPRSMLITNSVELFLWELKMDNGTMSNAQDHFSVQRLDL